jgi:uncharacterized phage-associated protein
MDGSGFDAGAHNIFIGRQWRNINGTSALNWCIVQYVSVTVPASIASNITEEVMPNHDPRAIANEFLRRRASDAWPQQLSIQKLTYIAHGWNLAINGRPLVSEAPQAWDNGPVFRSIWDHIKEYGYRGDSCTLVDPVSKSEIRAELAPAEKAVIDHVWAKYGSRTSSELSDMTHQPNTPWHKAYFGKNRNAPLDNEDIRRHYIELALAGRVKTT